MHCGQLAASLQKTRIQELESQYGHVKSKILTFFLVTYVIHIFTVVFI